MPAMRSLEDMLATELKAIMSAERLLSRQLPRLGKKVSSERLKAMLDLRTEQGEKLMQDIEESLEEMETSKGRTKNLAAEGLLDDITTRLSEIEEDKLVDPFLLSSVQKVEHYCIAAWGAAASMGRLLEQDEVVEAMERALDEGKRFDKEMTRLAENEINPTLLNSNEDADEDE